MVAFSFLSRFFTTTSKSLSTDEVPHTCENTYEILEKAIISMDGAIEKDFSLYYNDSQTSIDLLIFLPHYGLFLGEKLSWCAQELQDAQLESSKKNTKQKSTTHLGETEKIIHQKLNDVVSFNTTPVERFFWLECLNEEEFDQLDETFHTLMPKNRLIFKDESARTITTKIKALGNLQEQAFSKLKTLGSLRAHTLLLPTLQDPFGAFLHDEQYDFITASSNGHTLLLGDFGSGKTTAMVRKILAILLENPMSRVLIVTPTLLAGEIIRNKLISLADFAAITLDLSRLEFKSSFTQEYTVTPTITHIVCDDDERLHNDALEHLKSYPNLLLSGTTTIDDIQNVYSLHSSYRHCDVKTLISKSDETLLSTLLVALYDELRQKPGAQILILISNEEELDEYKKTIDAYCGIETNILNATFSLQRNHLMGVSLSTPLLASGISMPHVYLLLDASDPFRTLALGRASKRATVISETSSHHDLNLKPKES
jgi:hypothetical protein